jgi:F0F1-type ATP synthase membrane subunit c/vacuolar-type H+-ATPase subunit K
MLSATGYLAIGLAAIAAGLVNAIAGGGSLISYPTRPSRRRGCLR